MKSQVPLSKHAQLAVKKIAKFQDKINNIQTLIINNNINKAIQELKTLINGKEHLDVFPFKGVGNIQSWLYQFPKGPVEWFEAAVKKDQIEGNPFDLLNVCYMIQLCLNKMTSFEILNEYQKLKQGGSSNNEIKLGMANIYYQEERYLDAQRLYLELEREMNLGQNNYLLLEYISWVYYNLEVKSKARKYCQKSLILYSNNINAIFLESILQQDEQYKVRRLIELTEDHPSYYRSYLALGDHYFSSQQEGIEYYNKALQYEPDSDFINALIGQSYFYLDRKEKALQFTNKAKEMSSICAEIYFSLAKIAENEQKFDEAENNFMKSIELKPFNVMYHHNLGKFYYNQMQYEKALQVFQTVAKLNPYRVIHITSIAATYDEMNLRKQCQQFYKKALELDPNHDVALWNLGNYEITYKDNYHKANQYFIRGYQANPEDQAFWMRIATCYMHLKCYQEAKQWGWKYYNSKKQDDTQLSCLLLLGEVEYQLQNYIVSLKMLLQYQKKAKKQELSIQINQVLDKIQRRKAKEVICQLIQMNSLEPDYYVQLSLNKMCTKLNMRKEANQVSKVLAELQKASNEQNKGSSLLK